LELSNRSAQHCDVRVASSSALIRFGGKEEGRRLKPPLGKRTVAEATVESMSL
jgi:hypothetical protein